MAVAVQSHWYSVGSLVFCGNLAFGIVSTQSFMNPIKVLRNLIANDYGQNWRKLLARLPEVGLLTVSEDDLERLQHPEN